MADWNGWIGFGLGVLWTLLLVNFLARDIAGRDSDE